MSQSRLRSRSPSSLRSWTNSIPLEPLEHRPQDDAPSHASAGPSSDPAEIALPGSRQSLAIASEVEGGRHNHEDLSVNAVEAIAGIEPSSLQSVSGYGRDSNASQARTSVLELEAAATAPHSSADAYLGSPASSAESQEEASSCNATIGARAVRSSLEQIERICPVLPSSVLLPDSTSTSLHSSASISSYLGLQHLSSVVPSCLPLPESANSLSGRHASANNSRAGTSDTLSPVAATQAPFGSLEQIQRFDPDRPVLPSHVALPGSADGLSGRDTSARSSSAGASSYVASTHATPSSLEQLQRLDPGHSIPPSSVPLPESTETLPEEGTSVALPMIESYWQRVLPLQGVLPHLSLNLLTNSRHLYAGKVACFDNLDNGAVFNLGQFNMKVESDRSGLTGTLAYLQHDWDQTVTSRMILVEDMCPVVIEMLGRTFGLDPEFFAEHLNQSGYQTADWNDPPPARWNTAYTDKLYSSMTWCRPVYQNTKLTEWLQTPDDLLSTMKGSKENASRVKWRDAYFTAQGKRNTDAREHRLVLETNIFRQSWGLSARPLGSDLLSRQVLAPQTADWQLPQFNTIRLVPTAWQERVSVCVCRSSSGIPIGKSFDCPA